MNTLHHFGAYISLLSRIFRRPENIGMYWRELFRQMNIVGIQSIPIVAIVALFIGAVTALQFAYQVRDFFVPMYYVGYIVRDTMLIEMAPTMTAVMLAGKAGSNMASELGNMRISEQIDALEIMGVNTPTYLVGTKIVAMVLMIPSLVIMAAALGMIGGWLAVVLTGITTSGQFEIGLKSFYLPFNSILMLIKGCIFGFILSSVSCYQGYTVKGGAIQIGEASTRAVVFSDILILIADYVIAAMFL